MRCKMKKKHILQISNNQVSHFHNSTFFNKLSRLSHQTTLSRPSWLCFICVSIPLCHSQQLRECPVVSRERQHSCGLWEHWGEVGLYPSHCVQSAPQRQESLLHQMATGSFAITAMVGKSQCHHAFLISAVEITLLFEITEDGVKVDIQE